MLMEESIGQEPETSHKVLMDFKEDYTTLQVPGNCSYLESALDVKDSNSSTNIVSAESPHNIMQSHCVKSNNTSSLSQNMSSSPKDSIHMGVLLLSSSPEKQLKENTAEPLECDSVLYEPLLRPYLQSEENLPCVGGDKKAADHGYRSEQNIGVVGDSAGDIYGHGPVVILEGTGRCFSYNRQCIYREGRHNADEMLQGSILIRNTSTKKNSDGISDWSFGDQLNEDSTFQNIKDCNTMPSYNELVVKQILTKGEQTHGYCLHLSSECTNIDCTNQSTEYFAKTKGNTDDDEDSLRNEATDDQTNENHELHGQDKKNHKCQNRKANSNIQHYDESQTESLLIKTSPSSTLKSDSRYAEALARREEMVKDLGVDGSGLRVMCCMLAIILVFAIVIIIIAVVGL